VPDVDHRAGIGAVNVGGGTTSGCVSCGLWKIVSYAQPATDRAGACGQLPLPDAGRF